MTFNINFASKSNKICLWLNFSVSVCLFISHAREARVGQSPILMEYGQPLDRAYVRTYVRVYRLNGWGREDYQKEGRGVSGVSLQVLIFYLGHSQYG